MTKLYQDLVELFTKAHNKKTGTECQNEANSLWKALRTGKGKVLDEDKYKVEIAKLKDKIKVSSNKFLAFFKPKTNCPSKSEKHDEIKVVEDKVDESCDAAKDDNDDEIEADNTQKVAPKIDELKSEIAVK